MPQSVGQAHDSQPPGPHSFCSPHQTIGLGMLKQQVRHEGTPHGCPGEQAVWHVLQPGEWHAPGRWPRQQHPPPARSEAAASDKAAQANKRRASMARFPECSVAEVQARSWGAVSLGQCRARLRLSAGKLPPVEKIALTGKFCRAANGMLAVLAEAETIGVEQARHPCLEPRLSTPSPLP